MPSGLPGGLSSNPLEEVENPEAFEKIEHPREEDIQVDKGNEPFFYWRYISTIEIKKKLEAL